MPSLKVLIIEPSRTLAQLYVRVVEQLGGSATNVSSLEEAPALLRSEQYDVACFSASDGVSTAVSFARSLRAQHPTLPLLMLSASAHEELAHEVQRAGVTQVFGRNDILGFARYLDGTAQRIHEGRLSGRVLLVEDSVSIARMLGQLLADHGLEVQNFRSAEEALVAFADGNYDLVITDIVLAGASSGVGLVRDLRGCMGEAGLRVPILAMSSLDDTARRLEVIRSGATDWMVKPVLAEELIARVTNMLRNKRLIERVEAQQAELRGMALTDQLTQLHNRHFLIDAAYLAMCEARRHKHPLSLLVVDVDRFKTINDSHGHQMGDAVLTQVAAILRQTTRGEDIVARFGGEEFVLVLPHCSLDDAVMKAEQLRVCVERAMPSGLLVTVSIGATGMESTADNTFDGLFQRADAALYRAKGEGRNRVVKA
jgi:two-component system, cell cycle response regulator